MKTIKLDHDLAVDVLKGVKASIWCIYDDKSLSVNDQVEVIDKTNPHDPSTWGAIGVATIDVVIEKRLGNVNSTDYDANSSYESPEQLLLAMQERYGPEVSFSTPVKIIYFSLKASHADVNIKQRPLSEAKLYTDGGSRGNPGPSACGFVLLTADDDIVVKRGTYIGVTTNNQAEYLGLKLGLEEALRHNVRQLHVFMDSMLVINQMRGIFKVKNRDLWPIHESIKNMLPKFKKITFSHVPRELNKLADTEVNQALDDADSHLASNAQAR